MNLEQYRNIENKEKEKKDNQERIDWFFERLEHIHVSKWACERLMIEIETYKNLEDLKKALKNIEQSEGVEFSKEQEKQIVEAFNEYKKEVINELKQQREDLGQNIAPMNPTIFFEPKKEIYPSNKIGLIQKMEKSPLWKNPITDATGIIVGAVVDSGYAIGKLGCKLIKDIVLLPRDIIRLFSK